MESAQFISPSSGRVRGVLAISWSLPLQFCGTRPLARTVSSGKSRSRVSLGRRRSQGVRTAPKTAVAYLVGFGTDRLLVAMPKKRLCPVGKVSWCHGIVVSSRLGRKEVIAYPRLGASAALGIDPDVLKKGSVSWNPEKWAFIVGLLTSAMILPFWGSSRYLASCVESTCQSRVVYGRCGPFVAQRCS